MIHWRELAVGPLELVVWAREHWVRALELLVGTLVRTLKLLVWTLVMTGERLALELLAELLLGLVHCKVLWGDERRSHLRMQPLLLLLLEQHHCFPLQNELLGELLLHS